MALGKRYCPSWVYDCVVAQSVIDFISYKVDLGSHAKNIRKV